MAGFFLEPEEEPGVAFEEVAPEAFFGEDGPVCDGEGAAFEGGDDGVAHVGDEDGHGRDGDEGPHYEEGFAGVGLRGEIAVADGQEGDVAEVEGFEVAKALGLLLGSPKADGANAPEDTDFAWSAKGMNANKGCRERR